MIFCVGIQLGAIKSKIEMNLIKYSLVLYINEKPRRFVNERKLFHFLSTSDDWRVYIFLGQAGEQTQINQLFTLCYWDTKIFNLLIYWGVSVLFSLLNSKFLIGHYNYFLQTTSRRQ